jgi:hypothetical protein
MKQVSRIHGRETLKYYRWPNPNVFVIYPETR